MEREGGGGMGAWMGRRGSSSITCVWVNRTGKPDLATRTASSTPPYLGLD